MRNLLKEILTALGLMATALSLGLFLILVLYGWLG